MLTLTHYAAKLHLSQSLLKQTLNQKLGLPVDFNKVYWSWLPQPSLCFDDVKVSHKMVEATVPLGAIRLDWWGLLHGKSVINLYLKQPDIIIKTIAQPQTPPGVAASNKKLSPLLSILSLAIDKGRVQLPSDGFLKPLASQTSQIEIVDLSAWASPMLKGLEIKSSCRLSFMEKLSADISFKKRHSDAKSASEVLWELDISGRNIDLTAARKKVLLMFGYDETTRLVCDIVKSGRARTGRYQFKGTTDDFEYLDSMIITAYAEDVDIVVPEIELPLQKASGPIRIENSILTGKGLTASLGNSQVEDGELKLELLGEDPELNLKLNFDVPLAALPELLTDHFLTGQKRIIEEISKVKNPVGRLLGSLNLGGNLSNLPVEVTINKSEASAEYQRFQKAIGLERGTLTFYPDHMVWHDLTGNVGFNCIKNSTGSLAWDKGLELDIAVAEAALDTTDLLAELRSWTQLKKELSPLVNSLQGPLEVKNLRAQGDLHQLEQLTWRADVATADLHISTPLLPEPILVKSGQARLTSGEILATACVLDIVAGQDMDIEIDMDRLTWPGSDSWKKYQGQIKFSGRLNKKAAR